jgi:hypothetical protein
MPRPTPIVINPEALRLAPVEFAPLKLILQQISAIEISFWIL